jgi:autoinducer 2-degrading protein
MVCLAVTYLVLPNREAEAEALFRKLTVATRQEPGCRMYLAHKSLAEPRRFFLYEQYDDDAALQAHRQSLHFDELVQRGLFRIIEHRVPELYTPLSD